MEDSQIIINELLASAAHALSTGRNADDITTVFLKSYNDNEVQQARAVLTDLKILGKEDILILEALKKCNDIAFVLREHECDILAKYMKNNLLSKQKAVFVGKDFLSISQVGFYVGGFIPFNLLRKFKYAFKESGIWNWMVKLRRKNNYILNRREDVTVAAPKMDGNILVVFCLLICGVIFSVVCFICETVYGKLLRK